MDLKIFKIGEFTEQDYNNFCNNNLTFNHSVLNDGSIYVFYKPVTELGSRTIDQIEQLDKMTKTCQLDVLTSNIELVVNQPKIIKIKEDMSKLDPKQGDYKRLEEELKSAESRVTLAEATIKEQNLKIESFKRTADTILEK